MKEDEEITEIESYKKADNEYTLIYDSNVVFFSLVLMPR